MKEILVIKDTKVGTYKQALALAEFIGKPYEEINLEYNILGKLPNSLLASNIIHIKNNIKSIINLPFPKIIISCGRKTLPVAKYLKKQTQAKIIHIMWPGNYDSMIDLLITPKHDNIKEKIDGIIPTIGGLSSVTPTKINFIYEQNKRYLPPLKDNIIGLLIGGNQKKLEFTKENVKELINKINDLAEKYNSSILYTTSRRTPKEIVNYIKNNILPSAIDIEQLGLNESYLTLLGTAKYFIVTGDSVSMCSEIAATGKSLYIFAPENLCTKKQCSFHKSLFANNLARPLEGSLETWIYEPLQEAEKIAKYINNSFL